jgi:hypothetical protein
MDDSTKKLEAILAQCSPEERKDLFKLLRATHRIHQLEETFEAPAEVILEAIYRAPELTRRMLKGIVAEAAFAQYAATTLVESGWRDVTPKGNFSFDLVLEDGLGQVSVQVKLQRSELGSPVTTTGTRYGLAQGLYMVETQRTRNGKKRKEKKKADDPAPMDADPAEAAAKSRPYRFGDFDVLAVALFPSTKDWYSFRYTVGSWLLPQGVQGEIAIYQPVAKQSNEDWTDDFDEVARWLRSDKKKTIQNKSSTPDLLSDL